MLLGGHALASMDAGGGMCATAVPHYDDAVYGADYAVGDALHDDRAPVFRGAAATDHDKRGEYASPFRRDREAVVPDHQRPHRGGFHGDAPLAVSEPRPGGNGGPDYELEAKMAAWRQTGTISFIDDEEWSENDHWDEVVYEDEVGMGRTIADPNYIIEVFGNSDNVPPPDEANVYYDDDRFIDIDDEAIALANGTAAEPESPAKKDGPVQGARKWFGNRNAESAASKEGGVGDAPAGTGKGGKPKVGGPPPPADNAKKNDGKGKAAGGDAPGPVEPGLYDDLLSGMLSVSPDEFSKPDIQEIPFSLRQVAASVLKENRSIKVAAYKPMQAQADIMAAKSVYDPEVFASWTQSYTEAPAAMIISGVPSRNREYHNNVSRTGLRQHLPSGGTMSAYREWNSGSERNPGSSYDRGDGGGYVLELSQPILNGFADMENRTLIELSRIQVDVTQEELRQTVMKAMNDALEAYWNVAMAREDIRINMDSFDLAQRLLERELGRKDEGISTRLDVDRAREAVATRAFNVQVSREQELQAQENLKYLMNDRSAPIGMDVYVDTVENIETPLVKADLQKSIDVALVNRPEMLNVELSMKSSEARQRYAKHTLLPELNLVGSVRRNDKNASTPTSGSDTLNTGTDWSMGVEFAMPIGNMKARANMRKAEAEGLQLDEEKRNVRDVIITEVRTVVKNLELVVREIPLNKRAMEAAEKVLDGEWAKLELNQTGNRDLLSAQDLVAVTRRNYVNSLIRYNIYIIRLFTAQGVLLEKMGMKMR